MKSRIKVSEKDPDQRKDTRTHLKCTFITGAATESFPTGHENDGGDGSRTLPHNKTHSVRASKRIGKEQEANWHHSRSSPPLVGEQEDDKEENAPGLHIDSHIPKSCSFAVPETTKPFESMSGINGAPMKSDAKRYGLLSASSPAITGCIGHKLCRAFLAFDSNSLIGWAAMQEHIVLDGALL